MKASSLGEPHRNMGSRVRNARKHRSINRFAGWRPMKTFAAALDRVVVGRPVEKSIGEDRKR